MNYLAHLYLASNKGNARIGGLLGDFVKGTSKEDYSKDIQTEIYLHQLIEAHYDSLSTSFDEFFPELIKYAQEQRKVLSV